MRRGIVTGTGICNARPQRGGGKVGSDRPGHATYLKLIQQPPQLGIVIVVVHVCWESEPQAFEWVQLALKDFKR
jgi:hypothetical protein